MGFTQKGQHRAPLNKQGRGEKATEEAIHLYQTSPPVADQLPHQFENGAKVTGYTCSCAECESELESRYVRGRVIRGFSSLITIQAVGYCIHCHLLTRFLTRVRDDLSEEYLDDESRWRFKQWSPELSRAERLGRAIRKFLMPF